MASCATANHHDISRRDSAPFEYDRRPTSYVNAAMTCPFRPIAHVWRYQYAYLIHFSQTSRQKKKGVMKNNSKFDGYTNKYITRQINFTPSHDAIPHFVYTSPAHCRSSFLSHARRNTSSKPRNRHSRVTRHTIVRTPRLSSSSRPWVGFSRHKITDTRQYEILDIPLRRVRVNWW